ncbi:MAG TPA: bifunctional adenosylcobinamide kinase/adenosylcobinamide-phosphate guanylyltransferase [Syntrophorhabdaceae bacterium]|nr:bifunctional adenosylcobinamide kinase/adenosylcobinamide-phosphate guanylyltransferase [Syntrophorhabdaceae bacterium]
MKKIVLILGGAASGKSTFGLAQASQVAGQKAFIATAQALDKEMLVKIERHKQERGREWDTYEEPVRIADLVGRIGELYEVTLIDCLTLWTSNIMHAGFDLKDEVEGLVHAITKKSSHLNYIISNEVGMGLVPETPLGRAYRENLGFVNRRVASVATEVYLLAAGIPIKIKETEE